MLDAPSTTCGAALTSASGTPARRHQKLLKVPIRIRKNIDSLLRSEWSTDIMSAHLVQTGQDTACVPLCHPSSLKYICPYHSLLGSRFQSRLSAYYCQVLFWCRAQSSSPYRRECRYRSTRLNVPDSLYYNLSQFYPLPKYRP